LSDSPSPSFGAIVTLFRDIALMRRGPAELPVSALLLLITIAAQACLALVIDNILPPLPMPEGAVDHDLALLAIDSATTLLWGWVVLRLAGKPERFLQTATAVFGCLLIVQPVLLPATWVLDYYRAQPALYLPSLFMLAGMSVWLLVALARILKAATEWSLVPSLMLIFGKGLLTAAIAVTIFPDLLKQA
jgi:hypothetical protein